MTREEWVAQQKKKHDYDIYYFSNGALEYILSKPKSYEFEINKCHAYSTFIAIALLDE